MAYSCCAAFSATYRTLSRSLPKGRCGPCFSMMPNGSRHVPCARAMASRKSAAVSSSQCTESLLCAESDCAHTIEAQSALMESSSDLYKVSSYDGIEPIVDVTTAPGLGKAEARCDVVERGRRSRDGVRRNGAISVWWIGQSIAMPSRALASKSQSIQRRASAVRRVNRDGGYPLLDRLAIALRRCDHFGRIVHRTACAWLKYA